METEDAQRVYGERIDSEVIQVVADVPIAEETWREECWSYDSITRYLTAVESIFDNKVITDEHLYKLAVSLGKLGRKLDLSGNSSTLPTLIHTVGLLRYAASKVAAGHTVMAIESCSEKGIRVLPDVDLVYSDSEGVYFCDYTHYKPGVVDMPYLWPEGKQRKKYNIIRDTMPEDAIARVISWGIDLSEVDVTFDVTLFRGCSREADFEFSDTLMAHGGELTLSEVEMLLDDYSEKMSVHSDDRRGMVDTPPRSASQDICDSLISVAGINSSVAAKVFTQWSEEAAQHPRDSEFFSTPFQTKMLEQSTKESIEYPEVLRGCSSRNPFERLSFIMTMNKRRGITSSALTKLLSLCTDDKVHPVPEDDYLAENYSDGSYMTGVTAKRVVKDEELTTLVKLVFPRGKSWKGYQLFQKSNGWGSQKHVMTFEETESFVDDGWKELMRKSTGSYITDDTEKLIDDVMPDSELASHTRSIMKETLSLVKDTAIMSSICMRQEVAMALLHVPRKRSLLRGSAGSFTKQDVVVSLDNVGDRYAVCMSTLGPATFGQRQTTSFLIHGVFKGSRKLTRVTHLGLSYTFAFTPAQADWNIVLSQRALSWFALSCESVFANVKSVPRSDMLLLGKMPLLMMFSNSNRFSQAAEMVRYLFVNGSGLCSSPSSLYEKISWYAPKTHVERLYMLRMCKMADTLNVAKSWGRMMSLKKQFVSTLNEVNTMSLTTKFEEWDLAMPDEEFSGLSSQHVFNSFYTCRAMTMQRYNKTMSEALVLDKQLKARKDYLDVFHQDLKHEGRFRAAVRSKEHLIQMYSEEDFSSSEAREFSACPLTVYLGFLSTIFHMFKSSSDKSQTVSSYCKKVFQLESVTRTLEAKNVMNTRGSVRESGETGVTVTNIQMKAGKKVTVTQNSKCYRTILKALHNLNKGKLPPPVVADWEIIDPNYVNDPDADDLDLQAIITMSDALWPLIYYFQFNRAQCVSKMVHKDQIGAREIAVLNAASRVMCFYVEMLARSIRDTEHLKGLRTNLIERKDKMDIVTASMTRSLAEKRSGREVVYDSADCSKWGPSMMVNTLYITIASRITDPVQRSVIRNCLTLFGCKVFKIPDNFFVGIPDCPSSTNIIGQTQEELRTMSSEMGSLKHQIIHLPESMHQGILGCSSSVLGSDAQNLTEYVLRKNYQDHDMRIVSHITSDDYSRIISWQNTGEGDLGLYRFAKETLSIHVAVLRGMGIKRNLQKSALSTRYWEFNSEFFTSSGDLRPDIKSRLSYIDYGGSSDPYPNALRCMTQTSEFLRVEGSFVGACWVGLLNNQLAMYQNQSRSLYTTAGQCIYRLPLELGGLIRVDPLLSVVSSKFLPYLSNYERTPYAPIEDTISIMLDGQSFEPELMEVMENDARHVKVPSLSRSGTVHLCSRPKRSTRAIREFLMSLSPEEYRTGFTGRTTSSTVLALMACAHREESTLGDDSSAMRYAITQTVSKAKLYRTNSTLMSKLLGSGTFSRSEIHQAAMEFLVSRESLEVTRVDFLNTSSMERSLKVYRGLLAKLKPFDMSPVPRIMHKHVQIDDFANSGFVSERLKSFDDLYKPEVFSGSSDIHPWTYLESYTSLRSTLESLARRKQVFRMALRESDDHSRNLMEKVLLSNYMAGCRLSYAYRDYNPELLNIDGRLTQSLHAMSTPSPGVFGSNTVDLLLPQFPALWRSGKVRRVDVTSYMNLLVGDPSYCLADTNLRKQSLDALRQISLQSGDRFLVIDPYRLSQNFPSMNYSSSKRVRLWQKPLVKDADVVGREFIHQSGDHYSHDFQFLRDWVQLPSDTIVDKYSSMDLTSHQEVSVKLTEHFGFLVLATSKSGQLIQILSQSPIEKTKVVLFMNQAIEDDLDGLESLGVELDSTYITPKIVDMFAMAAGFRSDSEWFEANDVPTVVAKENDDDALNLFLCQDDEESDDEFSAMMNNFRATGEIKATAGLLDSSGDESDRDSGSEGEDDTGQEDILDPPIVVQRRHSIAIESNLSHKSKGVRWGDYSDEDEEEIPPPGPYEGSSELGKPLSEQGTSGPESGYLVTLAKGSVKRIPPARLRQKRSPFRYGYVIEVPVKLLSSEFQDTDQGSALSHLVNEITQLEAADAIWAKQYLSESLSHFGPIVSALESVRDMGDY